jgi:hypothetical protein
MRTLLLLVAGMAVLSSVGTWGLRMYGRYRAFSASKAFYTSRVVYHTSQIRLISGQIVQLEDRINRISPEHGIVSDFERTPLEQELAIERRKLPWYRGMKAVYERALSLPFDPPLTALPDGPPDEPLPLSAGSSSAPVATTADWRFLGEGRIHWAANSAQPQDLPNTLFLNFHPAVMDDAGLVHLQGLRKLRALYLADNQVSDNGLPYLSSLADLEVLDLARTKVSDAGLVIIEGLANLKVLDLRQTKVTDKGLEHLGNLAALETLYLRSTKVRGPGLLHLRGLKHLRGLDLSYTPLRDDVLTSLKEMRSLRFLVIEGTEITPQAADELRTMLPATKIHYGEEIER